MNSNKILLFFLLPGILLSSGCRFRKKMPEKVTFYTTDSLLVTGDLYHVSDHAQVILLCHQAGYSRGEYKETARELNAMGFNCLAVDLRSGNMVNGVRNETAIRARIKNVPRKYIDAQNDITAAVHYAYYKYYRKVILVGSSYSASLVMKTATYNELICAVASFSPGEYFENREWLKESTRFLSVPIFLTSSKTESPGVKVIYDYLPGTDKTQFIPVSAGEHGSKALWKEYPCSSEYWAAFKSFLLRVAKCNKREHS